MTGQFQVNSYKVPVLYKPDVCIVGAGASGIAAAIGAARANMSVLIVEKYGFCGGATVAGLSGTICGLFSSGNHPEQIVFGFADEFYRTLIARGGVHDRVRFGKTKLIALWRRLQVRDWGDTVAACGGPLAIIEEGDTIQINLNERTINLLIPEHEYANRLTNWKKPERKLPNNWLKFYVDNVMPIEQGAVFGKRN